MRDIHDVCHANSSVNWHLHGCTNKHNPWTPSGWLSLWV